MKISVNKCSIIFLGIFFLNHIFAEYPIEYTGCEKVKKEDFTITHLVGHPGRFEPGIHVKDMSAYSMVRFDVLQNGDDVDVFYGGFDGKLMRYDAKAKTVSLIKDFNTIMGSVNNPYNNGDHGLTGIKFHPDFETNRWLFVFYAPKVESSQNRVMLLERYEMTQDFQLINPKVILRAEGAKTDAWHSGGDMYFNAQGDLYLQIGDNVWDHTGNTSREHNAAWGSSGTTSFLGSTVRIHPDNSEAGYSVLKNNFGEYFAPVMNNDAYMDTSRVKPEIYVKGGRSNFYNTGHPIENILIWGEGTSGLHTDDVVVTDKPIFAGWPFIEGCAGNTKFGGSPLNDPVFPYTYPEYPEITDAVGGSLMNPNDILTLPVPNLADICNGQNGFLNNIMVQDLYFYGQAESIWPGRTFPPHFHETFVTGTFNDGSGNNIRVIPLIKDGPNGPTAEIKDATYNINNYLPSSSNYGVYKGWVDSKYGPDGALYVMARGGQYGPEAIGLISRVDYVGPCQDQAFFEKNHNEISAAKATAAIQSRYRDGFFEPDLYTSTFIGNQPVFLNAGEKLKMKVSDIQGRTIEFLHTIADDKNAVPEWDGRLKNGNKIKSGLYILTYLNAQGNIVFSRKRVF